MDIIVAATKSCNFRPILEQELKDEGLDYEVKFYEEHPEIFEKYKLKKSPLLICNGELVSVGMPTHEKILELCDKAKNEK